MNIRKSSVISFFSLNFCFALVCLSFSMTDFSFSSFLPLVPREVNF